MNYAILLSGGVGSRISSDIPKQYQHANGIMMVTYALMPLLECDHIDAVYVVAEKEWQWRILEDVMHFGLGEERHSSERYRKGKNDTHIAAKIKGYALPGKTRQDSIIKGMQEIMQTNSEIADVDTVLVHDAARPFLTVDVLNKCYDALPGHDGAMPVLPMRDTVYLCDNEKNVSPLLDRGKVYAGQAPELFCFKKYYQANLDLSPDALRKINGATEPAIMAGMNIAMIPGDEGNFKVTTDGDFERFMEIYGQGDEEFEIVDNKRTETEQRPQRQEESFEERLAAGMQRAKERQERSRLDKRWLQDEMAKDLMPLRLLLGLSPAEMGAMLGISEAAYKGMESGKREISWDQFLALLFVFHNNDRTSGVIDALGLYPESIKKRFKKGMGSFYG